MALSDIVQDTLLAHTEEIGGHLEYFQELEQATRMLNHPGESLIFQDDFLYMVERVDICLDFLKGHVCALSTYFHGFDPFSASLSRSRSLSASLPAVYDPSYDTHQNEFRRLSPRTLFGNLQTAN